MEDAMVELRGVALVAATVTMGLMAGVFGIYGNAVPGLLHLGGDGRRVLPWASPRWWGIW
jgi:hypothetical protein